MAPRQGYNESGGIADGWEQEYDHQSGEWRAKRKRLPSNLLKSDADGSFGIGGMPVNMEKLKEISLANKVGKQEDGTKKLDDSFWGKLKGIFGGAGGDSEEEEKGGLFGNMFGDTDWGKWASLAKGWMNWDTGNKEAEAGRRGLELATRAQDFDESSFLGQQARDDELAAIGIGEKNIDRQILNEHFEAQGRDTRLKMIPDMVKQRNYRVNT